MSQTKKQYFLLIFPFVFISGLSGQIRNYNNKVCFNLGLTKPKIHANFFENNKLNPQFFDANKQEALFIELSGRPMLSFGVGYCFGEKKSHFWELGVHYQTLEHLIFQLQADTNSPITPGIYSGSGILKYIYFRQLEVPLRYYYKPQWVNKHINLNVFAGINWVYSLYPYIHSDFEWKGANGINSYMFPPGGRTDRLNYTNIYVLNDYALNLQAGLSFDFTTKQKNILSFKVLLNKNNRKFYKLDLFNFYYGKTYEYETEPVLDYLQYSLCYSFDPAKSYKKVKSMFKKDKS